MAIFHLAIPTHDLDAAAKFYTEKLGATQGRRYKDHVNFNFFSHQVVCHLAPDQIPKELSMYPRHFGVIFDNKEDFDAAHAHCVKSDAPFFEQRFLRFEGKPEQHETFFIADVSNNLIEFKYYYDQQYNY